MFTPEFITETLVFFGALAAALLMLGRFYAALERPEPELIPDDGPMPGRVEFSRAQGVANRARLRALARRWPYREVERPRRWALVFLVLALVVFVGIAFRYA